MLSTTLRARIRSYQERSDDPIDNADIDPRTPTGGRRTYPQDWPAYDAAKTNEAPLFKALLQELLLLGIDDPEPQHTPGRKGFDTRTKLFAMAIKIYSRSDLRKTTSILKDLHRLHFIPRVPCYKSIDNFFNDHRLNALLDRLILITAIPFKHIEETAAIDATGFGVSKYDSWNAYKWGNVERKRTWRKLHAVVGCTTNIFVSAEVTEKEVADITMLQTVIGDKPRFFNFFNLVGDKAYNSRDTHNFLNSVGMVGFIAFKKNATGHAKGSLMWSTMYDYFLNYPEDFKRRYHQRSNVETCFHMLKQRFGHHLMTKNFIANQNEIKTRVLCHNLCVLIQEAAERGIIPKFDACVKMIEPVQN